MVSALVSGYGFYPKNGQKALFLKAERQGNIIFPFS
jgi:hypothetical protein